MLKQIIKRDQTSMIFKKEKIVLAIFKAANAVGGSDFATAEKLADKVVRIAEQRYSDGVADVEGIQDIVEKVLIEAGRWCKVMQTETRLLARYSETDQMGIIHHSNYAVWFEAGRLDFLRKAGIPNTNIEEQGIMLPLYEMNCKFKSPARSEDEIMVITSLKKMSHVRLCFLYQVINVTNYKLLATGETMHAWTDTTLKPCNVAKMVPDIYSILHEIVMKG